MAIKKEIVGKFVDGDIISKDGIKNINFAEEIHSYEDKKSKELIIRFVRKPVNKKQK